MKTPLLRLVALTVTLAAAGCQLMPRKEPAPPAPPPPPVIQAPVATHTFQFDPATDEVVGELQVARADAEDTLPDIARRFNLGYEEIVRANPGVDPWLPGDGREIVLPTQYVLPEGPREGLVINLAQLRVFYYPKPAEGELPTVITHPIGIGKVGWQTPEGSTKVTGKTKNPTWFPPASVRKEHAEAGDRLPGKVPPGPDNPLGAHMMTLGWPSYLIHGTNKPYGVGLRSSHGCIRFYPEDIAELYGRIPIGTKVTVVNQPFVFGWHRDAMYVQAFPVMEDDTREHPKAADTLLNAAISDEMWAKVKQHGSAVDLDLVNGMVAKPRGIAIPVSKRKLTVDSFIATSRHVENRLPEGANWDGSEQTLYTAEEFEAAKAGTPMPLKKAPPPKPAAKKATAKAPAAAAAPAKATATTFDVERATTVAKPAPAKAATTTAKAPAAASPAKPTVKATAAKVPAATSPQSAAKATTAGGAPAGSR